MQSIQSSKVKCKSCNGHGEVDIGWWHCQLRRCENCEGTGEVDWIRNVMPLLYNENSGEWEKGI